MLQGCRETVKVGTVFEVECFDVFGRLKWKETFPNLVVDTGLDHIVTKVIKGQAIGGASGGYADGRRIPDSWIASTAYSIGDLVRPIVASPDRAFICEVAGTSAASEPTWPTTDGSSVVDSTVTWREAAVWFVGLKGTGTVVAEDTMASHAGWTEITPYSNSVRPNFTPGAVSGGSADNSASKAVFSINATATVFGCLLTDLATKAVLNVGLLYGAGDFASSRAVINGDTLNVQVTTSVTAS